MQDVVQPEAAAKTRSKAKAAAADPKGPELQIARMLVRALWQQEWTAANPDKTPAERGAAWKEIRQARNEAELKGLRRALMTLKRAGVTMTVTERAAKAAESDADVSED
jgi:hypothetical protein